MYVPAATGRTCFFECAAIAVYNQWNLVNELCDDPKLVNTVLLKLATSDKLDWLITMYHNPPTEATVRATKMPFVVHFAGDKIFDCET